MLIIRIYKYPVLSIIEVEGCSDGLVVSTARPHAKDWQFNPHCRCSEKDIGTVYK